jgi:hypothetical protein
MSLRTRHLEKVPIIPNIHDPRTEERVCPHPPAIKSKDYKTRKLIEDVLWSIKTDQKEVEEAIKLIKQYNPILEGRKKRAGSGDRSGGKFLINSNSFLRVLDEDLVAAFYPRIQRTLLINIL